MLHELPAECPCGRCVRERLPLARLADVLADEWLAVERGNAAVVGEPLEAWGFSDADAREMLGDVMAMGHFPQLTPAELAELAAIVNALCAGRVAADAGRRTMSWAD